MDSDEPTNIELCQQLIEVLEKQRLMLLQTKWPRFRQLKKQGDILWQSLQRAPDDPRELPQDLRQKLLKSYQRIEIILAAQKHGLQQQLKHIRKHKPIVKAYRTWGKIIPQQKQIASM